MKATDRVKLIRPKRKPAGRFHHGDLREALLVACVDIVERDGHQAVSLRSLAKRVGVTEPAIYRHFANREALLVEVGKRGLDAFDEALHASAAHVDDPYDAARTLARAYVRYAAAHPGWFRLWFARSRTEELAETHADARQIGLGPKTNELMGRHLFRCFPPTLETIDDEARAYWAMMHGLSVFVVERIFQLVPTDAARIEAADKVIDVFVDGLRERFQHKRA